MADSGEHTSHMRGGTMWLTAIAAVSGFLVVGVTVALEIHVARIVSELVGGSWEVRYAWYGAALVQLVLLVAGVVVGHRHCQGMEDRLESWRILWRQRLDLDRWGDKDYALEAPPFSVHSSAPVYIGLFMTVVIFALAIARGLGHGSTSQLESIGQYLVPELPRALLMTALGVGVSLILQSFLDRVSAEEVSKAERLWLEVNQEATATAEAPRGEAESTGAVIASELAPVLAGLSAQIQRVMEDASEHGIDRMEQVVDRLSSAVGQLQDLGSAGNGGWTDLLAEAVHEMTATPQEFREALSKFEGSQLALFDRLTVVAGQLAVVPQEVHMARERVVGDLSERVSQLVDSLTSVSDGFAAGHRQMAEFLSGLQEADSKRDDRFVRSLDEFVQTLRSLPESLDGISTQWRTASESIGEGLSSAPEALAAAADQLGELTRTLTDRLATMEGNTQHIADGIDRLNQSMERVVRRAEKATGPPPPLMRDGRPGVGSDV